MLAKDEGIHSHGIAKNILLPIPNTTFCVINANNSMAAALGMQDLGCGRLASRCAQCERTASSARKRGVPAPLRFTGAGKIAVSEACCAQAQAEGMARMQHWLASPEALESREALLAQKNGRL